jgi:hypothetical protein
MRGADGVKIAVFFEGRARLAFIYAAAHQRTFAVYVHMIPFIL